MLEEIAKEFVERISNKAVFNTGSVFQMFGVSYRVCQGADCDSCAFRDTSCDFNADIPSCNNNVHFEVIKEGEKPFSVKHKVLLETQYTVYAKTEEEAIKRAKEHCKCDDLNTMTIVNETTSVLE